MCSMLVALGNLRGTLRSQKWGSRPSALAASFREQISAQACAPAWVLLDCQGCGYANPASSSAVFWGGRLFGLA